MSVPQHIAIIMDGNGRWAKRKGLPRNAGHTAGAKNVENICLAAKKLGVKYLTLYAFSTENWNRPDAEVKALMEILSESSDSALSDILLQRTGMMYRRLSDLHEELIKSEKTENK